MTTVFEDNGVCLVRSNGWYLIKSSGCTWVTVPDALTVKLFRVHQETIMATTECGKWLMLKGDTFCVIFEEIDPDHLLVGNYPIARHRTGILLVWIEGGVSRSSAQVSFHDQFITAIKRNGPRGAEQYAFDTQSLVPTTQLAPIRGDLAVIDCVDGTSAIVECYRGRSYRCCKISGTAFSTECTRFLNHRGNKLVFENDGVIHVIEGGRGMILTYPPRCTRAVCLGDYLILEDPFLSCLPREVHESKIIGVKQIIRACDNYVICRARAGLAVRQNCYYLITKTPVQLPGWKRDNHLKDYNVYRAAYRYDKKTLICLTPYLVITTEGAMWFSGQRFDGILPPIDLPLLGDEMNLLPSILCPALVEAKERFLPLMVDMGNPNEMMSKAFIWVERFGLDRIPFQIEGETKEEARIACVQVVARHIARIYFDAEGFTDKIGQLSSGELVILGKTLHALRKTIQAPLSIHFPLPLARELDGTGSEDDPYAKLVASKMKRKPIDYYVKPVVDVDRLLEQICLEGLSSVWGVRILRTMTDDEMKRFLFNISGSTCVVNRKYMIRASHGAEVQFGPFSCTIPKEMEKRNDADVVTLLC